MSGPAVGDLAVPRKIFIDTLRIVNDQGPQKPDLTVPLVDLFRKRGYAVVGQLSSAQDPHPDTYRLSKVIIVSSTLIPPSLGNFGSANMTVKGVLTTLDNVEHQLGPFSKHIDFTVGEFQNNDVTHKGVVRALTELFTPLADEVDKQIL